MNDFDNRIALAQDLRKRYSQQVAGAQAPQGRMVGNQFVAPNVLEYLAQGLRGIGGMQGEAQADKEIGALQTQRTEGNQKALAEYLRKAKGQDAQPEMMGNNPSAYTPAQAAVPSDMQGAYASLMQAPDQSMRQMGMQGQVGLIESEAKRAQALAENQRVMGALKAAKSPQEALAAGVPSELVKNFYESGNWGKNKVARVVDVAGANGEKMVQQMDDLGNPIGQPIPAYLAPVQVNQGGQVSFVTPKTGQSLPITMSPSERDASARGWASVQQGKERLALDKTTGNAKTTEGERTAGTLLQRLRGSQMQLQDALAGGKTDAEKPGLIAKGLRSVGAESAANAITSTARQRVENAQLDILDAALTLGTGAAYTKEQLIGYAQSYFPQIGDDPPTIADKQARLDNLLSAAEIKAGNAAASIPTIAQMRGKGSGATGTGDAPQGVPNANAIEAEIARRKAGK